jgi:hypothetical protein
MDIKKVAHSPPAKDRPNILPARYVLPPCSKHRSRHVCSASVSRSSPALGQRENRAHEDLCESTHGTF